MDRIVIKDLEVFAHHGVLPEEKQKGQKFFVTAELYLSLRDAGVSDDLSLTVNYADVCADIIAAMTEDKYDLIEAAAESVADTILVKYDLVKHVRIRISKPEAPIDADFDTVCVDIERRKHVAYLSIGSNLGDREGYLDYAVEQLSKDASIRVTKVSDYIVTKPFGDVEQDDFLNGALEIETLYTPEELLHVVNDIEDGAGRKRMVHWGPRTLDIDIILYDKEIIMEEHLTIPHPWMAKRRFVLEPLAAIAPYAWHPGFSKTVLELLYILDKNEPKDESPYTEG